MTNIARYEELEMLMLDWNCTLMEAIEEIVYTFYETAGFRKEQLSAEIGAMSDEELIAVYNNIGG